MATDKQLNDAITAVKNGVGDDSQQKLVAAAARQAGATGNRAKEAFKGK